MFILSTLCNGRNRAIYADFIRITFKSIAMSLCSNLKELCSREVDDKHFVNILIRPNRFAIIFG